MADNIPIGNLTLSVADLERSLLQAEAALKKFGTIANFTSRMMYFNTDKSGGTQLMAQLAGINKQGLQTKVILKNIGGTWKEVSGQMETVSRVQQQMTKDTNAANNAWAILNRTQARAKQVQLDKGNLKILDQTLRDAKAKELWEERARNKTLKADAQLYSEKMRLTDQFNKQVERMNEKNLNSDVRNAKARELLAQRAADKAMKNEQARDNLIHKQKQESQRRLYEMQQEATRATEIARSKELARPKTLPEQMALGQNNVTPATIAHFDKLAKAQLNAARTLGMFSGRITDVKNLHANMINQNVAGWRYWANFVSTQIVHKAIYSVINALSQAANNVGELGVRISEIRTISQSQQKPFEGWLEEARQLSDMYGSTLKDTVEGTYQTISNQVAKGTDALTFMNSAMKFSKSAVTSTATSVEVLTSALNSFNYSSGMTEKVAASLFKTIELGRVRGEEMQETYGVIAATAHQLGINIDELNTAITVLTVSGKKYQTAATEIRNIMLKIMKPTKEMASFFDELGVSSGKAALDTYGFIGFLDKINEKMSRITAQGGDAPAFAARLFGNIRGISGVLGLVGENFDKVSKNFEQYQSSLDYALKAANISMESHSRYMQIELNKVANYFTVDLGVPMVRSASILTEKLGGLVNVIKVIGNAIKFGTVAYIAHRLAITATTGAFANYLTAVKMNLALTNEEVVANYAAAEAYAAKGQTAYAAEMRILAAQKQVQAANAMGTGTALAGGAATLIGRLIPVATIMAGIYSISKIIEFEADLEMQTQELTASIRKSDTEMATIAVQNTVTISKAYDDRMKVMKESSQETLSTIADSMAKLTPVINELNKQLELYAGRLKKSFESVSNSFNKRLEQTKAFLREVVTAYNDSLRVVSLDKTKASSETFYNKEIDRMIQVAGTVEEVRLRYLALQKVLNTRGTVPQSRKFAEVSELDRAIRIQEARIDTYVGGAETDYANKNVETARKNIDDALAATEKLQDLGMSFLEIEKRYNALIQKRIDAEQVFEKTKLKQRAQLEIAAEDDQKAIDGIKKAMATISEMKLKGKSPEDVKAAYGTQIKEVQTIIANSSNPELNRLFSELTTDLSIDSSVATINNKLDLKIDEITKGSIESVDQAKDAIVKQLEILGKIQQAERLKNQLELGRKDLVQAREETQKLSDEQQGVELKAGETAEIYGKKIAESLKETKALEPLGFFAEGKREIELMVKRAMEKPIEPLGEAQAAVSRQMTIEQEIRNRAKNVIGKTATKLQEKDLKGIDVEALKEVNRELNVFSNEKGIAKLQGEINDIIKLFTEMTSETSKFAEGQKRLNQQIAEEEALRTKTETNVASLEKEIAKSSEETIVKGAMPTDLIALGNLFKTVIPSSFLDVVKKLMPETSLTKLNENNTLPVSIVQSKVDFESDRAKRIRERLAEYLKNMDENTDEMNKRQAQEQYKRLARIPQEYSVNPKSYLSTQAERDRDKETWGDIGGRMERRPAPDLMGNTELATAMMRLRSIWGNDITKIDPKSLRSTLEQNIDFKRIAIQEAEKRGDLVKNTIIVTLDGEVIAANVTERIEKGAEKGQNGLVARKNRRRGNR